MIEEISLTAGDDAAGLRLDRFIVQNVPSSTRALVLEAIVEGRVLLNGRRAAKGTKLRAGDDVRIARLPEQADRRAQPDPSVKLQIVFEDEDLLVLDKPARMPVHPLKISETGTLANGLIAAYPQLATVGDDPLFPALVHRIDTDTSGLVLAAKNDVAYAFLRDEFGRRWVCKEYTALVRGGAPDPGRLEHFLAHDPSRRGRMLAFADRPAAPGLRPMQAVTEYRVSKRCEGYSLLDVVIRTGVTHQIRCQLATAGYPIAGDTLYGGPGPGGELGLSRHFLHAAALEITHPRTRERVRFTAPLPQDLTLALTRLGLSPGTARDTTR